ncbi:MAG TPA: iron uptake transporter deferrochelatase/peroxidase subunit [Acidimicrobiia bacterium]|jgi:deferrochelatase/peroxidase EfeB
MLSRRRFLAGGGATLGAAAAASVVGLELSDRSTAGTAASESKGIEPFYGRHQGGIATAQQDRLLFAAFDLTSDRRADIVQLMQQWTTAAASMTAGRPVGPPDTSDLAPPNDTGEALGLDPARLTLTFGFGPGVFTSNGVDRYGLAHLRPAELADLPRFAHDQLDPGYTGGDICVQACSNDPLVAYHAVRNLTRIALGTAELRWTEQGFGRTSSTTPDQVTPRNLMGFKDGTDNIRSGTNVFDDSVWVPAPSTPAWMAGGSYMVVRRIRMHIEVWDRAALEDQQETIGRLKDSGAPIGAHQERDPINLHAEGPDGKPRIPVDAHVRLANQSANGIHILRRGYSFTDGIDPDTGQLDAGLFFIAYQRDPRKQFVAIQHRLDGDALNEYIQHVGSALFAVPPGASGPGDYVGSALFQ